MTVPALQSPDRSTRTRLALMEGARAVFMTEGFLNADIAQITRAANRATGTFYVHFANKLELLKAMLEQFREDLAQSGLDQPEHQYQAAPEVLRALWITHHRHAATFRALVEAAAAHPEMAAMHEELRRYARRDFLSMLGSAPRRRDDNPEDLALTAAALENMVNACLYEWHALGQRPEGYSEERAFEAILGIVLAVIGGPARPA
jgi:AcrR family transcriptional regulator